MSEYKCDEESVNALIEWANSYSFPQELRLSKAENIIDVKRYVNANISDIKAHFPDEFYFPSITRLYQLKEILEKND